MHLIDGAKPQHDGVKMHGKAFQQLMDEWERGWNLDVEKKAPSDVFHQLQGIFQEAEFAACLMQKLSGFFERRFRDAFRSAGQTKKVGIVHADGHVVGREPDVGFHGEYTEIAGSGKGGGSVFGKTGGVASVGYGKKGTIHDRDSWKTERSVSG